MEAAREHLKPEVIIGRRGQRGEEQGIVHEQVDDARDGIISSNRRTGLDMACKETM